MPITWKWLSNKQWRHGNKLTVTWHPKIVKRPIEGCKLWMKWEIRGGEMGERKRRMTQRWSITATLRDSYRPGDSEGVLIRTLWNHHCLTLPCFWSSNENSEKLNKQYMAMDMIMQKKCYRKKKFFYIFLVFSKVFLSSSHLSLFIVTVLISGKWINPQLHLCQLQKRCIMIRSCAEMKIFTS